MASTPKPVTATSVVRSSRIYPHVGEVADPAASQSLRLLWDKVFGIADQLTAAQGTVGSLVTAHNDLLTTATQAATDAKATLALVQQPQGSAAGGAGTATPPGSIGPPGTTVGGTPGGSGSGTSAGGGTGVAGPTVMTSIDGLPVTIVGGSPDVGGWTKTTTIASLNTSNVSLVFSKQVDPGRWPDVPFGSAGGTLQYTLWLFEQHGGIWYASGIIQFWFGRVSGGMNIACNNELAVNWTYDSRWGPMAGYQPPPGEKIGFMVTAGNQRGTDQHLVAERSNIVFIAMPQCADPGTFPPFLSTT